MRRPIILITITLLAACSGTGNDVFGPPLVGDFTNHDDDRLAEAVAADLSAQIDALIDDAFADVARKIEGKDVGVDFDAILDRR